jgi:hypothetical protein
MYVFPQLSENFESFVTKDKSQIVNCKSPIN